MQRRKFIAGLGSLTAAGAAGIGTGAFTSVQADRNVDVAVADDADALLALAPAETPNGNLYASTESGVYSSNANQVEIELDGDQGSASNDSVDAASGVNVNAETTINNLLTLRNQGSQEVEVSIDTDDDGSSQPPDHAPEVEFYAGTVGSGTRIDDGNGTYTMAPGDQTMISMFIDSYGANLGQIVNVVTINAVATSDT